MKLNEFVDKNGNKVSITQSPAVSNQASSGSFKKRFEKLIKYHIDHASSELESITTKDIKDYSFHLGEHYNTGLTEFDRDIVADADKNTGTLSFSVFVDGKEVYRRECKDYEHLVQSLEAYMYLPNWNSQEYEELLTEWVDKSGKKVSTTSTTSSTSSTFYKDKFKKLLDYHIANDYHIKQGGGHGTIEVLSEDKGKALFKYRETWEDGSGSERETVTAAAYFKEDSTWWVVRFVDGKQKEDFIGDSFNELVKKLYRYFTLPATNSSEYQALVEETSSIADDFKTYENLWD